jgi:hypothetical protein
MKRLLKIIGIALASFILLVSISLFLFRIISPSYLIPYVIEKVEKETNGRYTLSVNSDSLKIRFISMNLHLGPTEFIRNTSVNTYAETPFLNQFDVHASFKSIHINALNMLSYVFSKKVLIEEISIVKPAIIIRKNRKYNQESSAQEQRKDSIPSQQSESVLADTLAWGEFKNAGGSILPHLNVKKFKIEDAHFSLYGGLASYPISEVNGLTFDLTGFQLRQQTDIDIEDVFVSIESASTLISKNTARLTVQGVKMNPESFHIDSVHFGHLVDKYAINGIKGFRASWLNIGVKDIDIDGLHPDMLINDSILIVDKTTIGKVYFNLFKDKEDPKINPAYKPLPSEIIRGIPLGLKIDSIEILDADLVIDMEAPMAVVPGQVRLNQTKVIITNITNIPRYLDENPMMDVSLSTLVMGQIPVSMDYKINIGSPEDQYWAKCKVDPFNATLLNGFLGSQFFIEFKSGHIDNFEFEFEGNNKVNLGKMDFEYTKLRVQKLKGYEDYISGKPKTGFLSVVGNVLIPNNRSKNNKKYKPGAIYYEKEFNRPMIHATIMSMLSGVLSSMGLSSRNMEKQQKKAAALDSTAVQKSEEAVLKQTQKIDTQKEEQEKKEAKKKEKETKKEEKKEKKNKN